MKIYSMEECKQWLEYRQIYYQVTKQLFFIPKYKNEVGHYIDAAIDLVLDSDKKVFSHNICQIKMDVVQLCENYPVLSNIIKGDFPLFLAPSYPANCTNGYANKDCVCLWGKPTQIPSPMTDYIIGHEFGHVIQLNYFDRYGDDKHKKLMRQYLELRHAPKGMCHIYIDYDDVKKEDIYEDKEDFLWLNGNEKEKKTEWDTSPYEWFAEDFRYFFGVDKTKFWHMPISLPDDKIKEFILSLK